MVDLKRSLEDFDKLRKEPGKCYATTSFAAGKFNKEDGGVLKLQGRDDIKVVILPGALRQTDTVYMKLVPDTSEGASFSPVVQCGPPGLSFEVRLTT